MQLNPIADPDDCRTYKAYNYGAAIGIVVAVVVGIALLVVGFIFFYRRSRQVSLVCVLLAYTGRPSAALLLDCAYLSALRAKVAAKSCVHVVGPPQKGAVHAHT